MESTGHTSPVQEWKEGNTYSYYAVSVLFLHCTIPAVCGSSIHKQPLLWDGGQYRYCPPVVLELGKQFKTATTRGWAIIR